MEGGSETVDDGKVVQALDEFENTWYPVCRATLRRHAPEVGEWLFLNLRQTSGIDLVVGVNTFLTRYRALASGESEFGARGEEATAVLAARGLTDAVIGQVQAVLDLIQTFAPEPLVPPVDTRKAEESMWQWYLEWSTIARTAIKDRQLLRGLGFLKNARVSGAVARGNEGEVEEGAEVSLGSRRTGSPLER